MACWSPFATRIGRRGASPHRKESESAALGRLSGMGDALRQVVERYRSILAERNVALLLGAGIASELGDWFNTVALISLSFHFTDSALGVGGMFAARMLTRLLAQGPAGALVDRFAGRKLLFSTQLAMAAIASSFALLVVFPALWLLLLLVILLELVNCLARPAFMVELKAEAPEEQRAAANGALFASSTTAQIVGPPLGAIALGLSGPGIVFLLNGLTFLAVALTVAALRGGLRTGRRSPLDEDDVGMDAAESSPESRLGYRALLSRPDLSLYILVCLSVALLVQATVTLFVIRANVLGLGDGGVGIFYMAVAVGSVTGSVIAGARAQHAAPLYPAAIAMGICAIAVAMFGVVGSMWAALVALVIAGFATDFYEVVGLTYFQGSVPDAIYGRFFSVFLLALSAGALVGALAGPVLEQAFGLETTLTILAAPALILALLLMTMSKSWGSSRTSP
jgi:MFS family permease